MNQECGNIPSALVMSKIDWKNEAKVSDEEADNLSKELKLNFLELVQRKE